MPSPSNTANLRAAYTAYDAGDYAASSQFAVRALQVDENCADAWIILTAIALTMGDHASALQFSDRTIAADPSLPKGHQQRAVACIHLGNLPEARISAAEAAKHAPDDAEIVRLYGQVLTAMGNYPEALTQYRRAAELAPDDDSIRLGLAEALTNTRHTNEALAILASLVSQQPSLPHRKAMARALIVDRQYEAAYTLFKTVADEEGSIDAICNVAAALRHLLRFAEAEALLLPHATDPRAAGLLGVIAHDLGKTAEAQSHLNAVVSANPSDINAHVNQGSLLLLQNDPRGWEGNAYRPFGRKVRQHGILPLAEWDGQPFHGTLHVIMEQGIGDQIILSTLLPRLLELANGVTAICDKRLVPIFRRSGMPVNFVSTENVGPFLPKDKQVLSGDIQPLLGILPQPGQVGAGVLRPHVEWVADAVSRRIALCGTRKTVGVSWRSGNWQQGQFRSVDLIALADAIPEEYALVSLQYGDVSEDAARLKAERGRDLFIDSAVDQMADLDGFLAQIASLDTVVTIDNSTAHVTGGLGLTGYMLLPLGSGLMWYWGLAESGVIDPWYGTLTMLRQTKPGDWTHPLADLRTRL
jgi:tetratricopeptide (TPR) repeat protein